MYPNRSLTPYQQPDGRMRSVAQSYPRHLPTSPVPKATSSPESGVVATTSPRQPEGPSFFEQLLFNREQVYRDATGSFVPGRVDSVVVDSRLSSLHTTAPLYHNQTLRRPPLTWKSCEVDTKSDGDDMARINQTPRKKRTAPATRKTNSASTTPTVKREDNTKSVTPWKRSATGESGANERAAKAIKIGQPPCDVSATKRTKGSRISACSRGTVASPIDVGDSDDDAFEVGNEKTGIAEKIDMRSSQRGHLLRKCASKAAPYSWNWNSRFPSFGADSKPQHTVEDPDVKTIPIILQDTQELERLRKQLTVIEADARSAKQEMEASISKMKLEREEGNHEHDKEIVELREQLQHEKDRNHAMSEEMDRLRRELGDSHSRSEHDALIQESAALQEAHRMEREAHKVILESLQSRHTDSLTQIKASTTQVEILQRENSELTKEVEALKAAEMNSSYHSPLSPEPSSSQPTSSSTFTSSPPSSEAVKLDNIRQTYTKVKKRYDSLHSVATKLSNCTSSWDSSHFGAFGQHLKHLRQVLNEDGLERTSAGQARNKRDANRYSSG